jgi:hypothetical protein
MFEMSFVHQRNRLLREIPECWDCLDPGRESSLAGSWNPYHELVPRVVTMDLKQPAA